MDDSPLNLRAVTAALSDMVEEIVTAESGKEALRQLLRRDFAVVLLDVSMPGMDGYEVARLIRSRERNSRIPIIFVTAFDRDDRDVLRAYELGAVDFLFKPVQHEVLRAKVSVFVELHHRSAEVALQSQLLREHEQREYQRALDEQRRQLEAAATRRRMEEERRTSQRLAEIDRRKDRFLATLGHELRTPLAAMVAASEIRTSADAEPEVRERAQVALERQLQHLVRLVDDLLDVSRIGSGRIVLQPRITPLGELLDRAIDLAQPAIDRAGHTLHVERPGGSPELEVDPARIVQALANLLHNAARYTSPGGRIQLSAHCDNRHATITVEDNGCGIPAAKLEQVFDVFTRGTEDHDGLGLGLPLARRLVQLHGGTLAAHSDGEGRGARFDIELPLRSKGARPVETADEPEPPAAASETRRILVIEDNPDLRDTLRDLLGLWGHEVRHAATGEDGLRLLLGQPHDLALVDIGLPDLNGCRIAERARAAGIATYLVALTGFTQPEDRRRMTDAGFDEVFAKPPDLAELRRVVARCGRTS